jgi:uncharacterized protein (TIGR03067 family)
MRSSLFGWFLIGILLTTVAAADDAKDNAIKKDRQRIEGTWRVTGLTINGNKSKQEDARKLTVVNDDTGKWRLRSGDMEVSKGTSSFDPTKQPKRIDFTPTTGGATGDLFLGIYQLGKNKRKLCFAPTGKQRPTEFSSTAENHHILVTFERVKSE